MGFMDKFKDAAQQAQQAAKSAGGSVAGMGGMGGAADTAAKANKIAQQGVKHPAVLKGMRETGNKDPLSGGVEYELEVEVRPTGGDPYTATFTPAADRRARSTATSRRSAARSSSTSTPTTRSRCCSGADLPPSPDPKARSVAYDWACETEPSSQSRRHRHRDRRPHRRAVSRPHPRGHPLRGREPRSAGTRTRSASTIRAASAGSTPGSSSTTTATTRRSRRCSRARGRGPGRRDGDVDRVGRRTVRVREHEARAVRAALEPDAAALLAADPRPAALQPRGAAARRARGLADRRRVPARRWLLALVLRARDRARGLRRMVGRPRRRSGAFRSASSPSSSRTTASSSSAAGPQWRTITGGSRVYVERLLEQFGGARPHERSGAGDRAARRRGPGGQAAGGDAELLRPGRDRHPLRPGAGDARRPTAAERKVLGAMRYQANEAVLHTDRLPDANAPRAPGRAGTSTSATRPERGPRSPTG